jgi:hypothetical protein
MSQDPGARPITRRVAVIAVHGVGNQAPFASARAIGDLLQNQNMEEAKIPPDVAPRGGVPGSEDPQYEPFLERTLRINVRPVVIKERDGWADSKRGGFQEWVTRQRQDNQETRDQKASDVYDDEIATQFMRGQLSGYTGDEPEDTYETIRLEGIRHGASDRREIVHIYELYWADLSNLKKNLFKILTELYQILLHLPSLGKHAVDAEAAHHKDDAWTRFRRTHSRAVFYLSVVIPLINLFLLGNALAIAGYLMLTRQSEGYHVAVSLAVLALAGTAYLGKRLWTASKEIPLWKWGSPVVLFVLSLAGIWFSAHACGGVVFSGCGPYARAGRGLALVELVGIAAFLVHLVVRGYERMRPGFTAAANRMSIGWALITLATLLVSYSPLGLWEKKYSGLDGPLWLFRSFDLLEIASIAAWGVLMGLTAAAWVRGAIAVRRHVNKDFDRDRARRSQWTARLTLSVSMYAFATVTLIVWALIYKGLELLIPLKTPFVPLLWFANGTNPACFLQNMKGTDLTCFMQNVVSYGGIPALLVLLPAGLLAALPAIWGLAPVVWAEVRPPDFEASQNPYAQRLGQWLTLAFRFLRWSGRLLYLTTTVLMPIVIAAIVLTALVGPDLSILKVFTTPLQYLTAVSGLLIASLFMIRGQLLKAVLGFRTALDVMLDVDNWLREHPVDSNPKARICGRYVSLLRYICDWRDPFKRDAKYDAVVIVAHSQGTVISADLLRFLDRESGGQMSTYDPPLVPLADMDLTLFTMGCPLRDLYGLRFPRLYGWTRDSGNAVMQPLPCDLEDDPQRVPAPRGLYAVKRWINAYRSGDYIGRSLWRTEGCGYRWDPGTESKDGPVPVRREFCIGAGAHTHYWDHTAVQTIARELNSLLEPSEKSRPQDTVTA